MKKDDLYLGVDGGGTTCRVRLVDSNGALLGQSESGAANTTLGLDVSFKEIIKGTRKILSQIGLGDNDLSRIHAGLGLAGLVDEKDVKEVEDYDHPFQSVTAGTDALAACYGAHGGKDGGVLIFGTGSAGCALVKGEVITVGGWGFAVADQGSGAHLGQNALRMALLAHDMAVEPSPLSDKILLHFDNKPAEMLRWALKAKPRDYGSFVPLVVDMAENGDELACKLMRDSAQQAELLLRALMRQGVRQVSLLGGFAKPLSNWLGANLRDVFCEPRGDAMEGALLMLRKNLSKSRAYNE